jgi:hypothetical protein
VYVYDSGMLTGNVDSSTATAWNTAGTWATATIHMWTDNALTNTIGAFALAALGAALY